ncbi:uncharacterized protein MELLADRAFT_117376 [Melampsora larici-populina 98AG31]|uniref:Uncharacterized protein n=1 Tax=Melampsora larici-populina (strain 98AG31 / pathotype 3-4-7) TaxID=747676 RepID=F4RWJ0_MELLP|nr:uncharacterized protein MELLADRAFT_117376 [Melampsora larici-populina 98AG31]EGG03313.1 hypothetical protein MELLADRAFT_117376 [Melampsora larici-populina 98AG31]
MSSSTKPISTKPYFNQIHKSRPKKSSPLTTEVIFNETERLSNKHIHLNKINSNFQIFLTLLIDGIMFTFLCFDLLPRILNLNTILKLNHQSLSNCLPFCSQHLSITSSLIYYTEKFTPNLHLQIALIGFLLSFKLIYALITLTSSPTSSSITPLKYLLRTTGAYLTLTAIAGIHSQTSQITPSRYSSLASITSATILLVILTISLIILFCSPILWLIHQIIEEEDRSSIITTSLKPSHSNPIPNLPMRWYPNQPASAISPHKRALIGPGF